MPVTLGVDSRFMKSLNGIGRDSRAIVLNLAKKCTTSNSTDFNYINIELSGFLARVNAYIRLAMLNKQTFISTDRNLDIFLSSQVSPFASKTGKNVVRIHDLFPLQYPEYFKKRSVWLFQKSIKMYPPETIILFNSKSTRNAFHKLFPKKINKTYLLYCEIGQLSIAKPCMQCEGCKYLNEDLSEGKEILLSVGTLEPRKNYQTLITAYRNHEIKNKYQLIICGNNGWNERGLKKNLQKEKIILLQNLCDSSLGEMYKLAKLFVSCSFDEGFSLPAAEAKAAGVPLILSEIPVHKELHSDFAVYFDPRDPEDLISKVQSIPDNARIRPSQQREDEYQQAVHDVFQRVLNEN
jgi:glycosyltransferase involved in cell wall biosynthesis